MYLIAKQRDLMKWTTLLRVFERALFYSKIELHFIALSTIDA